MGCSETLLERFSMFTRMLHRAVAHHWLDEKNPIQLTEGQNLRCDDALSRYTVLHSNEFGVWPTPYGDGLAIDA